MCFIFNQLKNNYIKIMKKRNMLVIIFLLLINFLSYPQLLNTEQNYTDNINIQLFDEFYNWENQNINVWNYCDVPMTFNINVKDMVFPLQKTYVTSNYGYRKKFGRNHKGIDLKACQGDTVYAAFDGRIRLTKYNKGGYGYYIVIRHSFCVETLYAHLSKILVERNQIVKAGEPIALSGNTGRSTGPHLHFEIRFMGIALNPEKIANFDKNELLTQNFNFDKTKHCR